TTVCPVYLGHPGVLPVPNDQAIRWAVLASLALRCEINTRSHFDRKSYFYPDLPKGYQISQYAAPFGHDGHLVVGVGAAKRHVRIERVHLEEDTGKLMHESDKSASYVDYNRAGTPLLEIVTRPDLTTPAEAKLFLQELRLIMRYLGISDADMEKGHLRCDANVSLRPNPEYFQAQAGAVAGIGYDPKKLYPKTEVKNLNSFKAVERAVEFEIHRQTKLWDGGTPPLQQSTRGWDDKRGETVLQRVKEAQHDYRYFPEPDLPPLELNGAYVAELRAAVPELPAEKRTRFIDQLGLPPYDASILVADRDLASFFEQTVSELRAWLLTLEGEEGSEQEIWERHHRKLSKVVANWMISRLLSLLNERRIGIRQANVTPENFAELITLVYRHTLNNSTGQAVLEKMFLTGRDPSDIVAEDGLARSDAPADLDAAVSSVVAENPTVADQYRAGKTAALQFFVGQVMKKTKGSADPEQIRELLVHKLQ
ncbi:MAG: Asp-tRNA(Asn)/Glu-tRNA(Gln) amidotransferase subunit GatB, partial [Patescibacteria group bacterium]